MIQGSIVSLVLTTPGRQRFGGRALARFAKVFSAIHFHSPGQGISAAKPEKPTMILIERRTGQTSGRRRLGT
jgi:hypothetical protein